MSNDEMTLQAGRALQEYSTAKKELAHSEELLESTAKAHEKVAHFLRMKSGDNFPGADQMMQLLGAVDFGTKKKLFLEDGDRLEQILREHDAKRKRVEKSLATLRDFGFGNVK